MTEIRIEDLPELFESIAKVFVEKKDELCAMDANMGDGDLGLTMSKGYSAMPDLIRENTVENNVGKTLFKAGMKMASVVPSTMGTLMASGIMEAGKSLNEKDKIDAKEESRKEETVRQETEQYMMHFYWQVKEQKQRRMEVCLM